MKLRVKLDPGFPEHRKVLRLTDAAFRLHVHALCYATRNLTDGHLTFEQARFLTGLGRHEPLFVDTDERHAMLDELLTAGLWERDGDGGFVIHDFAEYQETAEKVEAKRSRWSRDKRRQRTSGPPEMSASDSVRTDARVNGGVVGEGLVLPDSALLGRERAAPENHSNDLAASDFGALDPFRRLAETVNDADQRSPVVWRSAARGLAAEEAAGHAREALLARRSKPGAPLESEARFVTSVLRRLSDERAGARS